MLRYFDEVFSSNTMSTHGVVTKFKNTKILDKNVRIQLYDTAGQEKFRVLTANYYREAQGVFLVYDCTNYQSFSTLTNWISQLNEFAP